MEENWTYIITGPHEELGRAGQAVEGDAKEQEEGKTETVYLTWGNERKR